MAGNGSFWARLKGRLEMLGIESPWVRLRARLEKVGIESPWARLKARLEKVGTESPWASPKARLKMLRTESPWARLRTRSDEVGIESPQARLKARLEMVRTETPWASLRARLKMFGIESPWARLRARSDEVGTESPWAKGDAWPVQYLTEHEARSIIMSCPAFWADEAPIGAGVRSDASASSHSKSRSVTISTRRSRVLDRPYGDSRLTIVHSSSGGAAPVDSRAAEALAVMQSCFNVDSTMTTRRLVEVRKHYYIPLEYELHVPLPVERPYNAFPSGFSLSTDTLETGLRFPLHPVIEACLERWQISPSQMVPNSWHYLVAFLWECYGSGIRPIISEGEILRKHSKKVTFEQPAGASGSTTRTLAEKGKGLMEIEEALERGYTIQELCEVEDRAGADKYFTSIMTQLKTVEGDDFLVYKCSSEELMNRVDKSTVWLQLGANQELVTAAEFRVKGLEEDIKKLQVELESVKNQRRELEQEAGVLRSSLDGAQNDRARLEGDVLSLTEVVALLEAELKAEGPRVVALQGVSRV
ncbi:hypothetical protein B296_00040024 [Ensete ventricosum]|uniref:Uncharacterized protein n=1 Tax=Ensete ventricosum TaxID=4639 RepID=A0A426X4A3_ENSVE|nr:hypothetical protein B296_00040024 [Ensete ventricosum]